MVEVYYNSGQFKNSTAYLEKLFPTPFALYETLASFYESCDLRGAAVSRKDRSVFLRKFMVSLGRPEEELDTCLIQDLYLRENLKSRPQWAKDITPYKEQIINFYRKEAAEHRYLPEQEGYDWKQLRSMNHIEPGAHFYLFDYFLRDPLDHNARIVDVTQEFKDREAEG